MLCSQMALPIGDVLLLLQLHFFLNLGGYIEDAASGMLADKALSGLGIVFQGA